LIDQLHSQGRIVICYIDTVYEDYRPESANFTTAILGNDLVGWPGEQWVDIRSTLVRSIMLSRLELAASKGCDAIEWDDVDAYENNPGFPLTSDDQINFNSFLANNTHEQGLSVGLKNDVDQIEFLVDFYDWALDESCYEYDECNTLIPFVNQSKAVFGTEYVQAPDDGTNYTAFCPYFNTLNMTWLVKNISLDAWVLPCCQFSPRGCVGTPLYCGHVIVENATASISTSASSVTTILASIATTISSSSVTTASASSVTTASVSSATASASSATASASSATTLSVFHTTSSSSHTGKPVTQQAEFQAPIIIGCFIIILIISGTVYWKLRKHRTRI